MASVVQKTRVSTETKTQIKAMTSKGDTKSITKGTSGATSISNATELLFSPVSTLSSSNVQAALEELSYRHFQSTSTPSTGVTSGDLWSDTSTNRLKFYDGSAWSLISGAATNLSDDYFRFTSNTTLTSGNVAEFRNNTTTVLGLQHDGVVVLKDQVSAPTAVANGLYSDGVNLYHGIE